MAQGMEAYQEDKKGYQEGRFGPRKKPAGAAGAALKPAQPKPETMDEMTKRHLEAERQAKPEERPAMIEKHNAEVRKRAEEDAKKGE